MPSWSRIAAVTTAVALAPRAAALAVQPPMLHPAGRHLDADGWTRPGVAQLALAPPFYQPGPDHPGAGREPTVRRRL